MRFRMLFGRLLPLTVSRGSALADIRTNSLNCYNNSGLAVIQQRFDANDKTTYWTEVDAGLADDIYRHPKFYRYFKSKAAEPSNSLYPTVTVRQIMWALKMKPLKRERWETVFDRADI